MSQTGDTTVYHKKKTSTDISHAVLQNENLSWKARGILSYILSLPPTWTIYKSELITRSKNDGREAFDSGWKELTEAGYIVVSKTRDSQTQHMKYSYKVYEEPEAAAGKPSTANPSTANPQVIESTTNRSSSVSKQKEKKDKNIKPESPASALFFDHFWVAYYRKGSKQDALTAWNKLTDEDKVLAVEMIPAYLREQKEVTFLKDAERYLGKKLFLSVNERQQASTSTAPAQNQSVGTNNPSCFHPFKHRDDWTDADKQFMFSEYTTKRTRRGVSRDDARKEIADIFHEAYPSLDVLEIYRALYSPESFTNWL